MYIVSIHLYEDHIYIYDVYVYIVYIDDRCIYIYTYVCVMNCHSCFSIRLSEMPYEFLLALWWQTARCPREVGEHVQLRWAWDIQSSLMVINGD